MKWRTGRKVGRTIYAVNPNYPQGDGELIGMMDTREQAKLAALAPELHDVLRDLCIAINIGDVGNNKQVTIEISKRALEVLRKAGHS